MTTFKKVVIFFFLIVSRTLYAQSGEIDSLKAVVSTLREDSTKVSALIDLGTAYIGLDFTQATNYGQQALALAKASNHQKGMGFAHKLLGIANAYQGEYLEADIQFKAALAVFDSIRFKDGTAQILNNLGS